MSEAENLPAAEPAKRTRGPRAAFTAGDIATMKRFGILEAKRAEYGSDPAFQKALALFSKQDPETAASLGLARDEFICDKRRGVFVSVASLGGVMGSKVKLTAVDGGILVSLAD